MILRFRTKDGTFRFQVNDNDAFQVVVDQLADKVSFDPQSLTVSDKPNDKGKSVAELAEQTIHQLNLKNGDMLFGHYQSGSNSSASNTDSMSQVQTGTASISISNTPSSAAIDKKEASVNVSTAGMFNDTKKSASKLEELPVDKVLDKQDGLIPRKKSSFCRHGDKGMCEYCSPLPPWDKDYRTEHGIKHLSFHAYLKEINESKNNKNNATSYMAPLEEPSYAINKSCPSGHLPYPRGICSKCQPPVITLQQQQFRMVDHVEFLDSNILNRFIDSWRLSGTQRFGYLYGSYETYDKVPLGIKAKVELIYEPPQSNELDGLTLLPWENELAIDELAAKFNLYKVGMIFSDLTDSGLKNGTVLSKRHKDSYFLSNLEVLMAARNQIKNPNHTKYCNSHQFSSKFVTCVVSGGLQGEIEPRSYQVSVNTEALVKADIITSSTQPSMMYINESNDKRYVPDVFYSKINEYGLEVKSNAKPAFPIDFLLVTLLDSMPLEPNPKFKSNSYIIENREFMGDLQNFKSLYSHLNKDLGDGMVLFDFHLLAYLQSTNILLPEEFDLLVEFVNLEDKSYFNKLIESPGWMSLITILEQSS